MVNSPLSALDRSISASQTILSTYHPGRFTFLRDDLFYLSGSLTALSVSLKREFGPTLRLIPELVSFCDAIPDKTFKLKRMAKPVDKLNDFYSLFGSGNYLSAERGEHYTVFKGELEDLLCEQEVLRPFLEARSWDDMDYLFSSGNKPLLLDFLLGKGYYKTRPRVGYNYRWERFGEVVIRQCANEGHLYDLRGSDWREPNFVPKKISHLDLDGADFTGLDLRRVNFQNCSLRGVVFARANLCGTKIDMSDVSYAHFEDSLGLDKVAVQKMKNWELACLPPRFQDLKPVSERESVDAGKLSIVNSSGDLSVVDSSGDLCIVQT